MKKIVYSLACCLALVACNGGGGSSSSSGVMPNPYPPAQSYPTMPNGFESAIPSFAVTTTSNNNSLQIAYGYNNNPAALELTAFINQRVDGGTFICSATPVAGDGVGGTWLIGAAHCFLSAKQQLESVISADILSPSNLTVYKGLSVAQSTLAANPVTVFIQKDYCYGSTFTGLGKCPNFDYNNTSAAQGNDIALIHITESFNSSGIYPQIVPNQYPTAYTMAPVLSLGYGVNTQTPLPDDNEAARGTMFYVVNYFYQQSDNPGYHYLYNSYFNPAANGYSALVCGGDSGGGDLFWNGSQWLLLSEHTYGPTGACGEFYNYLPNAATNVSSYYGWLTNIINSGAGGAVSYCNTESANCVTNG